MIYLVITYVLTKRIQLYLGLYYEARKRCTCVGTLLLCIQTFFVRAQLTFHVDGDFQGEAGNGEMRG